jgi:hypothetical protein
MMMTGTLSSAPMIPAASIPINWSFQPNVDVDQVGLWSDAHIECHPLLWLRSR